MLQVVNPTPLSAALVVFANPAGVECAYAAVKASFDLSSGLPQFSARQAGFLAGDVHWGDPAATSLRAAADLTHLKPATDILLLGRAIAAGGPVEAMDVSLRVGPVARRLRVFGNRQWVRQGSDWAVGPIQPFERMPLVWELAFGGRAPVGVPEVEARNPVGRGLVGAEEDDFAGRPLPNIEDPDRLVVSPVDRPAPAGFAPIPPAWQPRRGWAGTYDDAWQTRRAPYLPLDFDPRFFNVAPPGLVAPGYLVGGEEVEVIGCTAGGALRFCLPRPSIGLEWDFDGRAVAAAPRLDTILIEPDQGRLQMVWRAELVVDKRLTRLRQVAVHWEPEGEQR